MKLGNGAEGGGPERIGWDAAIAAVLDVLDARAALQQPAVQPECECGCGYPNSGPYVRRAAVQPEGGPE